MTNLEKLEEAIYKALSRLKEIKDGCKIKVDNEVYTIGKECVIYSDNQIGIKGACVFRFQDEYEIIGREIALNDVLEWLKVKGYKYNSLYFIECISIWNLEYNLLKDQSEELINYLTELL